MSLHFKKIGVTLLASSALLLAACSTGNQSSESEQDNLVDGQEINLVYVPWDTELASTNVIGQVLESVGFDVTLTSAENVFMWESLATNQADAMVGAWLPITHEPMLEEYGDQVEYLGTNYKNALIGLTVPSYMDVDSITELDSQIEDKNIVGIEDGTGTNEQARRALEHYGKDEWTVQASSSGAMATELQSAYEDQENVMVTGWTPHWMFEQMDLKMLEDPDDQFGATEYIQTFSRQGLGEDMPIATAILEDFYWSQSEFDSVMLDIQEGADPEEAAQTFIEENPERVNSWLEDAKAVANGEEKEDGPHSTAGSPEEPTAFDQQDSSGSSSSNSESNSSESNSN